MDETREPSGDDLAGGSSSRIGAVSLGELYDRGSHLYSTRTSEAFDAVDVRSRERILLWTLRFPLALDSTSPAEYVKRLDQISQIKGPYPKLLRYGVDTRGIAFLATEYLRGRSILDQTFTPKTLERTFVEVLQVVAPLHKAGIVLGDLSLDSFALDDRGRVVLWALQGPFESGARQTAMLPPAETLHFLAPEQRTVSGITPGVDVYALGVFGYRLITGKFLQTDKGAPGPGDDVLSLCPPPSSLRSDAPAWVDDVIGRCLEHNPDNRFRDVSEVLQVMFEAIQSGIVPGGGGRWSKRTLIVSPKQREQAIRPRALAKTPSTTISRPQTAMPKEEIQASVTKAMNTFTWVVAVLVGVLAAALLFFYFERSGGSSREDECAILTHAEYAPPELKPLIFDVTAEGVTPERREEALGKIAENRDPIAYAVLLALTKCNAETRLKKASEKFLVQRIGDQGTVRAASVLNKWLEQLAAQNKSASDLPIYSLFLRACDLARPLESRQQALKESYAIDPEVSIELAAALSLDEREEHFLPVLRALLADQSPGTDLASHGAGALIVSNPRLNSFFSNEIPDLLGKFSEGDLRWILEQLARSDSPVAIDVAKELVQRKALSPFRSEFLRTLVETNRKGTFDALSRALVRGSLGKLEHEDIVQFARWMSLEAEPVLLATCATVNDQDMAVEAFEILAGKSIATEPAASLIRWVKSQYWDYRKKMAKPVGIMSLIDLASKEDLDYAMGELMPFAGGGTLFRVLVQTNEERLIQAGLDRMGEIISSEDLLSLLGHRSRSVRISAVKALKGRNDLAVLQGILQAYAHEKDEDVRALYRELHWVTRDRDKQ